MSPESDRKDLPEQDPEADSRGMDKGLVRGIGPDSRFESGVPAASKQDDEAFAQLAGLSPAPAREDMGRSDETVPSESHDPVFGLSFEEKGVADVDEAPLDSAELLEPLPEGPVPESSGFEPLEDLAGEFSRENIEAEDSALPTTARPPMPGLSERLMEAEWLLQELERQPRDRSMDDNESDSSEPGGAPCPEAGFDWAVAASRARKAEAFKVRRRSSRFRQVLGYFFLLLVLGALFAAAVLAYLYWPRALFDSPERRLEAAGTLMNQQRFEEAAIAFQGFTELFPQHPRRPEAQLSAALAMRQAAGQAHDQARRNLERAIGIFERFLHENPDHPQYQRADTLMRELITELREITPHLLPEPIELPRTP